MLPPGQVTFYFSENNEPRLSDLYDETAVQSITVPKTNIIRNVIQSQVLLTETYLTNMKCVPRPPPKQEERREKLKTPWSFFNSVFRDYKPDNKELLDECFEFDWSCSKLEKIIKNEEERIKCKQYLKSIYKQM